MAKLENDNYMSRNFTKLAEQVCIGWYVLQDQKKNKSTLLKGQLTKNNVTHYAMEFAKKCDHGDNILDQVIDTDITILLNKAIDTGSKYCLVLRDCHINMGQFLVNFNEFFLEDFKNEVLVGHLLDWKKEYYELHHQSFMIDLEWWTDAGKPNFDSNFKGTTWTAYKLERSEENFHDPARDHTPIWVKPTTETAEFQGWREGAKVIAAAVQDGKPIRPWTEKVRNSRKYLYPELKIHDHCDHMHEFDQLFTTDKYYAVNTEVIWDDHSSKDYHAAIIPSSGILNLIKPYQIGLNPGGYISVFDYSLIGLRYSQHMANWPINTPISDWIQMFINKNIDYTLVGTDQEIQNVDEYISSLGEDYYWWRAITWSTYGRTYHHKNLLFFENYKDLVDDTIKDIKTRFKTDTLKIYINLTNIFHYPATSLLHSLHERVDTINRIEQYNKTLQEKKNVEIDLVMYKPLLKLSNKKQPLSINDLPDNLKDIINYEQN